MSDNESLDEDERAMREMMGFSTFGSQKPARAPKEPPPSGAPSASGANSAPLAKRAKMGSSGSKSKLPPLSSPPPIFMPATVAPARSPSNPTAPDFIPFSNSPAYNPRQASMISSPSPPMGNPLQPPPPGMKSQGSFDPSKTDIDYYGGPHSFPQDFPHGAFTQGNPVFDALYPGDRLFIPQGQSQSQSQDIRSQPPPPGATTTVQPQRQPPPLSSSTTTNIAPDTSSAPITVPNPAPERQPPNHSDRTAYTNPITGISFSKSELDALSEGKVNKYGDTLYFRPGFVEADPWKFAQDQKERRERNMGVSGVYSGMSGGFGGGAGNGQGVKKVAGWGRKRAVGT